MLTDTIAAISTPPGEGGIGIVRISGPLAREIGLSLFRFAGRVRKPESHRLYFGHLLEPQSGQVVDEVLFAFMRAPRTYTREDVVEINCHGGIVAVAKTLQLVLAAGARLAEPGEFTQRAFLNGRLDLAQAEAVIQVIRAKTEAAMTLGVAQLQGRLSVEVRRIRETLLPVLVQIEAAIDFPEHQDVEEVARETIGGAVAEALGQIGLLLKTADKGLIFREGLRTAIVGRPNVGKSSLLNALLGQERAIVTAIPGTTRDVLEESINMGGVSLVIVDTAGIRKTQDMVESIGVLRSQQALSGAGLALLVLDAVAGVTPEDQEILEVIGEKPCLVVINKTDLLDDPGPVCRHLEQQVNPHRVVPVSVLARQGLKDLEQSILATVFGGEAPAPEPVMVTSVRHKEALRRASESLLEVQTALQHGQPVDFLAIDLHAALSALGEITGETVHAELAEEIFLNFCIGK
ncbi:MAG: tRNA uridine-5-carboxymethylaminomethyl(34) synthesis GTPase MnmE [Dethiobacter sp.]|nr:tRNA uridine-5-carboxymethylaminomethyl(34) synthesis GTPase MnmE [Dethiobacter sp.]MCL5981484.1 tRNA uridine-5-carboxymethylaminomethyl(34) synthesis GTPase MnmE [Bacillota bacterium]